MRSLNEALLEEQAEEKEHVGYIDIGQVLSPFERSRLMTDPTIPVYMDPFVEKKLAFSRRNWENTVAGRRKDVPVTKDKYAEV